MQCTGVPVMKNKFILASGSPRRRELLSQVGIKFSVKVSDADEDIEEANPRELVKKLSFIKADDVYYKMDSEQEDEELVVIGADTIVVSGGKIMGKPKNRAGARKMINRLQGRSHYVYTGVTVMTCDKAITFVERTKVKVYKMNKKQIDEYLNTREYVDKAGAYGIQGAFAAYVKSIKGDYNNVVGLPVGRLCYELRKEGII